MLAGPVLLAASWAATLAQPDEFDLINHPTSDLGADTADAAWVSNLFTSILPGLLVLVFAEGLWHVLGRHRSARVGTGLVGKVGVALFLTGIFTLDCRVIDAGCENTSSQAIVHSIVAGLAALAILASPFVVARGVRFTDGWQDLRIPSLVFGVLAVVGAVVGSAVGEGLASYVLAIVWFAWVTILAVRMLRLVRARPAATTASRSRPEG
jgi:hypothetical membrane protein